MSRITKKLKRTLKLFLVQSVAHQIYWLHFTCVAVLLAVLCRQWEFVGTALFFQVIPPVLLATALTFLLSFASEQKQNAVCVHHWNLAVYQSPLARLARRMILLASART